MSKLRKIVVIAFAATSIFTLSACGEFIKEFKKELGVGGEAETLTFYDGQFTAHKPDGWTILDDLNDQADLGMGNYLREAYALFLTEPKTDFDEGMTYQTHSDITRGSMESMVVGFEETEPKAVVTSAGHEGVSYEIRGSVDGIQIVYLHVTVETDDHIHQILQWSLPSKFTKNLEDYNAVWMSLKPKNTVRAPVESGA
jgi:hypothetical protein